MFFLFFFFFLFLKHFLSVQDQRTLKSMVMLMPAHLRDMPA